MREDSAPRTTKESLYDEKAHSNRLQAQGKITETSLYSLEDQCYGDRESLRDLLTCKGSQPGNIPPRFAWRLIRIADIVYAQSRQDPELVTAQFSS